MVKAFGIICLSGSLLCHASNPPNEIKSPERKLSFVKTESGLIIIVTNELAEEYMKNRPYMFAPKTTNEERTHENKR